METWDPGAEHFTIVFRVATNAHEPLAAIAWRGKDVIAIEFHELLEISEAEADSFARELRIFEASDFFPQAVPVETLEEMLDNWIENIYPLLPVIQESDARREQGLEAMWPTSEYSSAASRQAPVSEMRRIVLQRYMEELVPMPFIAPTDEQVARIIDAPEWLAETGFNRAQSKSRLQQLQAVGYYLEALQNREAPIQYIAQKMDIDPIRARNVIQFARDQKYLVGGSQGLSRGMPTRLAVEMAQLARRIADEIGGK